MEYGSSVISGEVGLDSNIVEKAEAKLLEEMLVLELQLLPSLLQVLVSELSKSCLMISLNAQGLDDEVSKILRSCKLDMLNSINASV